MRGDEAETSGLVSPGWSDSWEVPWALITVEREVEGRGSPGRGGSPGPLRASGERGMITEHSAGPPPLGGDSRAASVRQPQLPPWETFLGLSGKDRSGGRIAASPEMVVAAARGASSIFMSAFSSRYNLEYLSCSACVAA